MAQKKRQKIQNRRANSADKIIAATLAASTILTPCSSAASSLIVHEKYKEYSYENHFESGRT